MVVQCKLKSAWQFNNSATSEFGKGEKQVYTWTLLKQQLSLVSYDLLMTVQSISEVKLCMIVDLRWSVAALQAGELSELYGLSDEEIKELLLQHDNNLEGTNASLLGFSEHIAFDVVFCENIQY